MNDNSLLDELLRHKLAIIDRKLEELEAVGEGERKIVSISMAYVKRVEIENAKLKEQIDSLMDAMVQHRTDIDANRDSVSAAAERIEAMAQWAKTKGRA